MAVDTSGLRLVRNKVHEEDAISKITLQASHFMEASQSLLHSIYFMRRFLIVYAGYIGDGRFRKQLIQLPPEAVQNP